MAQVTLDNNKRRRLKRRWGIAFLAMVTLGPFFFYRVTSFSRKIEVVTVSERDEVAFDGSLRVATWNIAHGRGATDDNWAEGGAQKQDRLSQISKLILEFDADIVVLNEVDFSCTWSGGFDQAAMVAEQANYPYCVKQSNLDFGFVYGRWDFGNVILSRYPIRDASVVTLTPVNQWEDWVVGCKRGLSCSIELSSGVSISVVGLHLESRGEVVRVKQAADVSEAVESLVYPALVAGDLNTTPSRFPNSRFAKDNKNAFDELIAATGLGYFPQLEPSNQQLTYSATQPKSVIDWILFQQPEFELVKQNVVPTELSDHLPVVAEFRLLNGKQ